MFSSLIGLKVLHSNILYSVCDCMVQFITECAPVALISTRFMSHEQASCVAFVIKHVSCGVTCLSLALWLLQDILIIANAVVVLDAI